MKSNYIQFVLLLLISTSAFAESVPPLTEVEATKILKEAVAKKEPGAVSKVDIRAIVSCYPVKGAETTSFLCLIDATRPSAEGYAVQELPFQFVNSEWQLMNPEDDYTPACPKKGESETLLRELFHDKALEITSLPEEGVVTDERGLTRSGHGPLRLMCTYGIKRAIGEFTVGTYLDFQNGRYKMDADKEVLSD